jgi:limonene-1,2-epoxide hydrolase
MARSTHRLSRRAFGATAFSTLGLLATSAGAQTQISEQAANVAIVNDFCAAFKRKDLDRIGALLDAHCVYRVTQTRPPMMGREAVLAFFRPALERGDIDFHVLRTVSLGPLVVNERDDLLPGQAGRGPRTIRVQAGLFFVQNGKIVEWTDYVLR